MSKVHDLAVLSTSLRVSYENIPAESVRIAVAKTPITEVYPVSACRPKNEVYPVFRALGCKPASPQFGALRMASYSVKNKVSRTIVWPIIEPKACKNAQQQAKKEKYSPRFGNEKRGLPGCYRGEVRNGSQYEVYPVTASRSPPWVLAARLRPANYSSGSAPI